MPSIALDLDGTICFDGISIPASILRVLEELPDNVTLALASARHPVNIAQVVPHSLLARCEVVGANGALALRHGSKSYERRFELEAIASLLYKLDTLHCAYLAYGADFVIPSAHPHAMHRVIAGDIGTVLRLGSVSDISALVKVLVLATSGKDAAITCARQDPALTVAVHSDGTFDVMPVGTDKTSGLTTLGYTLPLDAAMGNDTNDVALLRNARLAVAVGNNDILCQVADFVVPPGRGLEARVTEALQRILQIVTGVEQALRA